MAGDLCKFDSFLSVFCVRFQPFLIRTHILSVT